MAVHSLPDSLLWTLLPVRTMFRQLCLQISRAGPLVYACNIKAEEAGITPGMPINAALALLPALDIRQRQRAAEAASCFRRLQIGRLTIRQWLASILRASLLLEIRGSLHLFGGIAFPAHTSCQ